MPWLELKMDSTRFKLHLKVYVWEGSGETREWLRSTLLFVIRSFFCFLFLILLARFCFATLILEYLKVV
jgi:hypothetical protein